MFYRTYLPYGQAKLIDSFLFQDFQNMMGGGHLEVGGHYSFIILYNDESSVHKTIKRIQVHRLTIKCVLFTSLLNKFFFTNAISAQWLQIWWYFTNNIFGCTVITNDIIFSRTIYTTFILGHHSCDLDCTQTLSHQEI